MSVNLFPTWVIGDVDLTDYPFSVDRDNTVDIGEPETITEATPSMLADGDIERIVRYGNRVYKIEFYIEGPTLADVADSEALLRREIKRNDLELTHNPGDYFSVDSVYEVRTAVLTPGRRDDFESHLIRAFTLTLTCAPFARSAEPVIVPAMVNGAYAPTLIDDCSSATGWSSTVDGVGFGPVSVVSGSVRASDSTDPKAVTLRREGTIVFGAQRYLILEVDSNAIRRDAFAAFGGVSRQLPKVSSRLLPNGWTQLVFDTGGGTVSDFALFVDGPVYGNADVPTRLWIGDVSKASTPPQTSPRQLTRVIEIGGTERTPASIHVASTEPSTGLDMTYVHTCPEDNSGYSPPLRRWRVSGNTENANANTFSGFTERLHSSVVVFDVPTAALPEGEYALCGALRSDTATTAVFDWSARTVLPGGTEAGIFAGKSPVQFFVPNVWTFAALTPLTLPTVRASANSFVRIRLAYLGANPPNIDYDDLWLFRVGDDCALTVCNIVPQHLWLDSPGVSSGVPEVSVSNTVDRASQWNPGESLFASTSGGHVLHPDGTALSTGTRNFNYAAAEAWAYRRWHSNAAS